MNQRRVVSDVDIFDSKGRDFGDENAAECVGDGGVKADEGEGGVVRISGGVKLNFEVLEASQHGRLKLCCRLYFSEAI